MKSTGLKMLGITGVLAGLFAFTTLKPGGIQGTVSPADGVKEIMAVSGTDTIRGTHNSGTFVFGELKKGTYSVVVKAVSPFKDTSVDNIVVTDTSTTNIGEIKLMQ